MYDDIYKSPMIFINRPENKAAGVVCACVKLLKRTPAYRLLMALKRSLPRLPFSGVINVTSKCRRFCSKFIYSGHITYALFENLEPTVPRITT